MKLNEELADFIETSILNWEIDVKQKNPELFLCEQHNLEFERADQGYYLCPKCYEDMVLGFNCS